MLVSIVDLVIVGLYIAGIAAIGLTISLRGSKSVEGYFLGGKSIPSWAVGFTLMATLISTGTVVAHPGVVFKNSMILVPGFLMIPFVLVFTAYVIVPFYRKHVKMTSYEYIGVRFGQGVRGYTALAFVFDRTFDIGFTLVTTALFIKVTLGISVFFAVFLVGIFTMIYTAIGGIRAVVWTDVVQGIILIMGTVIIVLILLFKTEQPFQAITVAWEGGKFGLGDTGWVWTDPERRTVWMFMLGITIIWARRYMCDQNMVQRYLLAKSDEEGRRGTLMAAWLSVPILLGFNIIGAALWGFYEIKGIEAPAVRDEIFPHFIGHYLPIGLVGLMLAAILSASMSSISSDLNSIGTTISKDFLQKLFPKWSPERQLDIGRFSVFFAGFSASIVGLLLVPDADSKSLVETVIKWALIINSATLGLFVLGFFTKTATLRGAYCAIASAIIFIIWAQFAGQWPYHDFLIGPTSQLMVFVVGYFSSLILGGYKPNNVNELCIFSRAKNDATAEISKAEP